jgi:hypothetical protein
MTNPFTRWAAEQPRMPRGLANGAPPRPLLAIAVDHSDAAYVKCGLPPADIDKVRRSLVAAAQRCVASASEVVDMLVVRPQEVQKDESLGETPDRLIVGLPDLMPTDPDEITAMVDLASDPRPGVLKVGWRLSAESWGDDRLGRIFALAADRRLHVILEPYLDLVDIERAGPWLRDLQDHPAYAASKLDLDAARQLSAPGVLTAPFFLRSAGMAFDDFRRSVTHAVTTAAAAPAGLVVGAAIWHDFVPRLARASEASGPPAQELLAAVSTDLAARAGLLRGVLEDCLRGDARAVAETARTPA